MRLLFASPSLALACSLLVACGGETRKSPPDGSTRAEPDDSTRGDDERNAAATVGDGCVINSDCDSPLVCANRRCHTACESSRDCEPGRRCMASDRPFHVCQLEDESACAYNSDCPANQICGPDLECRDQCVTHSDCVPGQICANGACGEVSEE